LEQGYQLLMDGAEWVMTVGEYATPIERAYRRQGDRLLPNQPELMPMRSQDLEPAFFDAGQFYWAQAAQWQKQDARIWDGTAGVILPFERAVDIDTPADWDRAERLFKLINQEP
jgi:N-acylneuraminate cytidylyltransferase